MPIGSAPFGAVEPSKPVPPLTGASCCSVASTPDALFITTPAVTNGEIVTEVLAVNVVTTAVDGVVAPIAVLLIPVAVTLKLPAPMSKLFTPNCNVEAERPDNVSAPDVPVILTTPVVTVRPFDAVRSPFEVMVPAPVVKMFPLVERFPTEVRLPFSEIVNVAAPLDCAWNTS